MIRNFEDNELARFYDSLTQEVRTIQQTSEEGGNFEQIFTQWAVDLLTEGGETENVLLGYDERFLGTKNQHKINGWAISENYETVDLFITIYKGSREFTRITKDEIDTAVKRISNFFSKSVYGDYVGQIAESSPIFDFAHTLSRSPELKENLVRVNALILTDGLYPNEFNESKTVSGYPVYYRVIDINYLYNITEKSHIPIEINFADEGFEVPCIAGHSDNADYRSYLAIVPGKALATIYERFGSRLLEQNVRSFLQFTGKINKGIRNTILKEPHMFLAFNNGLAATAESVEFVSGSDGKLNKIAKISDLQIVNGGQTTASIYHTYKKDKADISGIYVQLKLTVISNPDNFASIVSQISEYANTQNKVSISDLSSNRPFHIELEKISRNTVTPHVQGKTAQTYWFYERARGQYKNARLKEGFRKSRQAAFDLKYPKDQVFTKEDLAKFANSWDLVNDGKKIVIGPHFVVRGNQKNYKQFIDYNLNEVDSIYFEDVIAKMILFRNAEKIYGVRPNSIGDMRYITVPYSLSYLNHITNGKLDLYKIWRNQTISESLVTLLYRLMIAIEGFIKQTAPGSLYGEWAKKEECWLAVKAQQFVSDLSIIAHDLTSSKSSLTRKKRTNSELEQQEIAREMELLRSVTPNSWIKISAWGKDGGELTDHQRTTALTLSSRVRLNTSISDHERKTGIAIFDKVIGLAAELFDDDSANPEINISDTESLNVEITTEVIAQIVKWDKRNKRLKPYEFTFMNDLVSGKLILNERNEALAKRNFEKVSKWGFVVEVSLTHL